MAADNLIGLITFNPFRAGVPGRNQSVGVQLENRIVGDRLDQLPITTLAFDEGLLEQIVVLSGRV